MPRVGEYELLDTIGRGAFSKVKLCTHTPSNTQYVAKILPINRDVETEVRREISILRRVRHPNVVLLKEILQSARNYYIILEPVRGGDLCSLIMKNEKGLTEEHAAKLFSQLVDGVSACHQHCVAHRDLKPENLLLTSEGNIKISDFGLSRLHNNAGGVPGIATPQDYASTLTGTLAYVAPEVLLRRYDAFKADMWSLGCILYVMLTCRFPFGAAQGKDLEEKIKVGDFVPLTSTVSADARDLVNRLMRLSPDERLTLTEVRRHPFLTKYFPEPQTPVNALAASYKEAADEFEHVDDEMVNESFAMPPGGRPLYPDATSPKAPRRMPGTTTTK